MVHADSDSSTPRSALSSPTRPPVAPSLPVVRTHWGQAWTDRWEWLQDADDPQVRAHLEAENRYHEAVLDQLGPLPDTLFREIRSRVVETDLSVPVKVGDWYYYARTEEGQPYAIHCRRPSVGAPAEFEKGDFGDADHLFKEQILLDENVEAGDHEFFDLGPFAVSPDHRLLFWGQDVVGDEVYSAGVRDLSTGEDLPDRLEGLAGPLAWSTDNGTVFYVTADAAKRPYQVWRHSIGESQDHDQLVFQEDDERFFVGVGLDKDEKHIQIGSGSKITDEVWIIRADRPFEPPRLVAGREEGVEYALAHRDNQFVILTNRGGAVNFTVCVAPDSAPEPEHWIELSGLSEEHDDASTTVISDVDVTDTHLVLYERAGGQSRIRLRAWADGHTVTVPQPETPSTTWPGINATMNATELRYGYSSMVTPPSVRLFDPNTGTSRLLKEHPVKGGYEPSHYATQRLWAMAPDGTKVPLSVVWNRAKYGDRPGGDAGHCVLYVYGAYEVCIDPVFSAARLSLLDRGFAFVIAHVRGGGELGRQWYMDGKLQRKPNTFSDLVAAARYLIAKGWARPEGLVLRGGSAGGLAVGAALNMAPELFGAVVAEVPFVDALNTMLDPTLPLTVTEWEEWGNPLHDESAYHLMSTYAPTENVKPAQFPPVLATAGLHDTRVGFWEPTKWVQALRDANQADSPICLSVEMGAGHGGPTDRYAAWREEARVLAFILGAVGRNIDER